MAVHTKSLENGFYHSLLWQWGSGTYFLNVPKYLAVQGESIFHSPPPTVPKRGGVNENWIKMKHRTSYTCLEPCGHLSFIKTSALTISKFWSPCSGISHSIFAEEVHFDMEKQRDTFFIKDVQWNELKTNMQYLRWFIQAFIITCPF